ncbi:hypothetical protein SAMN04488066_12016 [Halorubrum aquaticum]|uniref:Uncharacterized protein n=1 Tax=Halorubrum aquaticum TaxID=387340 RepID=A0A1I3C872_9EURY|nr:hypothetical protein [Halorubrum aquaticum]SFH70755.1 hypothetical protein SAMN04488066_12016 [Halorubrum aquaticum]
MNRITRRSTLRAVAAVGGTGGAVSMAGCAGGGPVGGDDDAGSGGDDDAGSGGDDDGDSDAGDGEIETTVHRVAGALSGPAWRRAERPGFCTLFDDRADVEWLLGEARPETVGFAEETDFDGSVLAYVESVGRNTCDRVVEFAEVAVDDGGTLTAEATVVDADGEDVACGQAITYSGAFLRVTADPLPELIRVGITDGWGNRAELTGADGVRDPSALDGFVRPAGDPPNVPSALACPDERFERHPIVHDGSVNWGSGGGVDGESGLELRVVNPEHDGGGSDGSGDTGDTDDSNDPDGADDPDGALRFERGDAFRVEMTNVSARPIGVGNHSKYTLEVETDEGWTDVRGTEDGRFEYTDELLSTRPGETVEWSFTMDEAGLVAEHPNDDLRVCPDLRPGRYRFVFFGADDLAVAFDHVE